MNIPIAEFDHPAWFTAVATALGYGVVLAVLTILLFAIPLAIFTAL